MTKLKETGKTTLSVNLILYLSLPKLNCEPNLTHSGTKGTMTQISIALDLWHYGVEEMSPFQQLKNTNLGWKTWRNRWWLTEPPRTWCLNNTKNELIWFLKKNSLVPWFLLCNFQEVDDNTFIITHRDRCLISGWWLIFMYVGMHACMHILFLTICIWLKTKKWDFL